MFHNAGLIVKSNDSTVTETVSQVAEFLSKVCRSVLIDDQNSLSYPTIQAEPASIETIAAKCDIAIIIGGDGTFLSAARTLMGSAIPLLGINKGRLGFLTDIVPTDITRSLAHVFDGEFEEERRFLLDTVVFRGDERVMETTALNDVVAHKWRIARLLTFETYIDDCLVNSQRSDGLIISTPTGSTAYALSSGGPILHPSLDAITLVPICPHTLSTRPIVVRADSKIEVRVATDEQPDAQLTCDGQTTLELSAGDCIRVSKHPELLRLIHPRNYNYYATLRAKLHWGRDF